MTTHTPEALAPPLPQFRYVIRYRSRSGTTLERVRVRLDDAERLRDWLREQGIEAVVIEQYLDDTRFVYVDMPSEATMETAA